MGLDSPAVSYPVHSLLEQVGVNMLAKSLKLMESEGTAMLDQISSAPIPLPSGSGSKVDMKA